MYGKVMMACELRHTYKHHPLKRQSHKICLHFLFPDRTYMGSWLKTSHRHIPITPPSHTHHTPIKRLSHTHQTPITHPSHTHHTHPLTTSHCAHPSHPTHNVSICIKLFMYSISELCSNMPQCSLMSLMFYQSKHENLYCNFFFKFYKNLKKKKIGFEFKWVKELAKIWKH